VNPTLALLLSTGDTILYKIISPYSEGDIIMQALQIISVHIETVVILIHSNPYAKDVIKTKSKN